MEEFFFQSFPLFFSLDESSVTQDSIEMARTADQAKPRKGKGVEKRVAKKSVMKIKSDSAKIKKVAGGKMKAPKVPFSLPSFARSLYVSPTFGAILLFAISSFLCL